MTFNIYEMSTYKTILIVQILISWVHGVDTEVATTILFYFIFELFIGTSDKIKDFKALIAQPQ